MNLFDKLTNLKLTTKQKELFSKLGLETVFDVLNYYPSRYNFVLETPLEANEKVVIEAKITSEVKIAFYQGKKNRIYFDVLYQNRIVKVVIFNRAFMLNSLKKSSIITILGSYNQSNNTLIASEIKLHPIASIAGIYPIYSIGTTYKNANYVKLVSNILEHYLKDINDILPIHLRDKYQLKDKAFSLKNIHFPSDKDNLMQANRRLIYEEFFVFALKTIITKRKQRITDEYIKEIDKSDITYLLENLKYDLTVDQRNALNDIYSDFKAPKLMNRLLLADVGSGKTLVALIASYMIYRSGYQIALMAPTTILAIQHYQSALEIFSDVEINIVLLTSNTSNLERLVILEDLRKGKIDLLIGTHALYQDDVIFKNLGLVVFDEQQRFGVKQRTALKNKGTHVEQLMLSATPIPRTLAQVAYASIQVSYMKEALPFKKPIISYYYKSKSLKPFLPQMVELLAMKQQIYIVTPLVEESESIDTKNAIEVYNNIKEYFKDQYVVDLIHGKLDNETKHEVMDRFACNETNILVATSLIEVGISVNNATAIIIYDAHRFGLSQLHQLRGRVGRGQLQGYCVFLSNSNEEETIKKMEFIASTNNGFDIAEYDLKTRGPGDVLGIKQSGIPSFNLANPFKDEKIYELAYRDALELLDNTELFKQWFQKNELYLNYIMQKDD